MFALGSPRPPTPSRLLLLALVLAVLGILDWYFGAELSFALFFLIPVVLAAWHSYRWAGPSMAWSAAAVWLVVEAGFGRPYANQFNLFWNGATRLGIFLLVALLLRELRDRLQAETRLALQDALTGLGNSRMFERLLDAELSRARRHQTPISLAFFDLNGFKKLNDRLGHAVGDEALRLVGETIATNTRTSDASARLGGDEFAVLLAEAGAAQGKQATEKLVETMNRQFAESDWNLTVSAGVATFLALPSTGNECLQQADRLMYDAKREGGTVVKQAVFE